MFKKALKRWEQDDRHATVNYSTHPEHDATGYCATQTPSPSTLAPLKSSPSPASQYHFGQPITHEQTIPYGQSIAYGQPNTYGQHNAYGQPNTYGLHVVYGHPNTYGQHIAYGQPDTYGQDIAYGQPSAFLENTASWSEASPWPAVPSDLRPERTPMTSMNDQATGKRRRSEGKSHISVTQANKKHQPGTKSKNLPEVISLLDDDDDERLPPKSYTAMDAASMSPNYPYLPNANATNPTTMLQPVRGNPQPTSMFAPRQNALNPYAHSYMPQHDFSNAQTSGYPPHNLPTVLNKDPVADAVPIIEPILCEEQARLVDLILDRRNVFYTGSAGCGKSTVLKAFTRKCQEKGLRVNIIAPTGRAALDINGSTTWTYAGWTPDSHKKPLKDLKKAAHGKFVQTRMTETDVLVIDEISMVENLHLERLNAVMKEARGNAKAFGGVQLVVTGDFCQLPPVKPFQHCIECGRELKAEKGGSEYKCTQHGIYYDKDKWAFRSQAWQEANFEHVNLTQIHRQSDLKFISILQKLRMGHVLLPAETNLLLDHPSETHNAVKLFATREEVKRVNDEQFNKLKSKARPYKSLDYFRWNEKHGNLKTKGLRGADGSLIALREHRFDTLIQLKQGMLVVLLANLDIPSGLVNGSQGVITGWEKFDKAKLPKASQTSGSRRNKERELENMASVGPVLSGDYAQLREDQIKEFINGAERQEWPIVRFLNGVTRTIYADCTVNELGDDHPHSLLSRTQIPLMAAWAMTTHKSQGMTLNRVIVDLAKSFEQGQAYVALSRARSLEGLKVISFPQRAQGAGNEQVKEFLRENFGIQ